MDTQNRDFSYNRNNYNERGVLNIAKRYDKEFKFHAVKQVVEVGKTAAQVARELDITNQTLCTWVQQYRELQNEPFVGSGNLRSDDKALKDLEKQLRDLQ